MLTAAWRRTSCAPTSATGINRIWGVLILGGCWYYAIRTLPKRVFPEWIMLAAAAGVVLPDFGRSPVGLKAPDCAGRMRTLGLARKMMIRSEERRVGKECRSRW